jgi:hypothetical protein
MGDSVDDDGPVVRVIAGGSGAGGFDDTADAAVVGSPAGTTVVPDSSAVEPIVESLVCAPAMPDWSAGAAAVEAIAVVGVSPGGSDDAAAAVGGVSDNESDGGVHGELTDGDEARDLPLLGVLFAATTGHCALSANVRSRVSTAALAIAESNPVCQTGVGAFEVVSLAAQGAGRISAVQVMDILGGSVLKKPDYAVLPLVPVERAVSWRPRATPASFAPALVMWAPLPSEHVGLAQWLLDQRRYFLLSTLS